MSKKKIQNKKNHNNNVNKSIEKTKPDIIKLKGQVIEVLPNTNFKVLLDDVNTEITATLSGKMQKNHIRVLKGDIVNVELSTYDLTKGRITFRDKIKKPSTEDNE